jgi:carboxyl-terminal processing protease
MNKHILIYRHRGAAREGVRNLREWNRRSTGKQVIVVFLLVCVMMTAVVSGLVLTNVHHLGNFVRVWQLIHSDYMEPISLEELVDGATQGIVDALGDPYSTYLDARNNQELTEQIMGKFGGIGIVLNMDAKKLVVLSTIRNTPAAKAGIQPGDVILRINDTDVEGISREEAVAEMRGDPGTQVSLAVYRENEKKTLNMSLVREKITVPTVEAKVLPGYPAMAYVNISQFSAETGSELAEAVKIPEINQCKGMILDLRYNHGGELKAAVQVASHFIPSGPVVYIVDKRGEIDTRMTVQADYWEKPLVVLVNGESASAAEIVAGAIKDKGTGILVGEKTFGKGIVQTIFELNDEAGVKLTTAKYLTPNRNDIHKTGIEPDIQVELGEGREATLIPAGTEFDAQLQKAVQALESRLKS